MSDETTDDKLGPMPESTSEEPQLSPGGTDAVPTRDTEDPQPRDLDPHHNAGVDDVLPDEVGERDDKQQAPEGEADDKEAGTVEDTGDPEEPDAGQEAEDGTVEPPA